MQYAKKEETDMYIGNISKEITPKFYHANTDIPFDPAETDAGLVWASDVIYTSDVDIKYTFDKSYYVGEVVHGIKGAEKITVFVDGVRVSANDPTSPVYVNLYGSTVVIRVRGKMAALTFSGAEIYGFAPDDSTAFLLPRPKVYSACDRKIKIGKIVGDGDDGIFAADFTEKALAERLENLPDGDGATLRYEICKEYGDERYTVSVTESATTVKAGTRLALLWGACRVIDLWDGGYLPVTDIDDTPDVPMRGFHMGLPERSNFEFFKKLVRYVLLPFGYNHVILEFNGDMRYDRHPEITEKWLESERLHREGQGARVMHADIGAEGTALEKSEVRELVEAITRYGIEVIPEVQSLSHIEYITNAHPEFAELGKYLAEKHGDTASLNPASYVAEIPDADISGIHHTHIFDHCYCPSDERCMQIIYDIIDEVVEVVQPRRYVHIGHDEVYHVGLCSECRKKGGPKVYVEHVTALYEYIAKKGLKTMLWSDMLHTDMYYTGDEYATVKDELPNDLALLDFTWYYHFDKDIEDELLPAGYKNIMMGNLYSSHYPRFAERIAKDGMTGGEVSTWTAVSEDKFALNGKFFDLPYTAEMLWNAYSYTENDRASLTALIGQCIIPEVRDLMHGRYDLYLSTDTDEAEILGTLPGDTSRVPEELMFLGLTEPKGEMEIGGKYDRLIFEHTTLNPAPRICWQDLVPVGSYTVVYEDGKKEEVPVNYAGGILNYSIPYGLPLPQQYYRHQGYVGTWYADPTYECRTAEGAPVLLLGQIWDNPHPEKKIQSVSYTADDKDYAVLLSAGVLGIKIS